MQVPGFFSIYRRRPIVAVVGGSRGGTTSAVTAVAGGREKDLISGSFSGITIEPETTQAAMIGVSALICPLRRET